MFFFSFRLLGSALNLWGELQLDKLLTFCPMMSTDLMRYTLMCTLYVDYISVLIIYHCILQITLNLHYLWIGPLQAVVIISFLWYEIGLSCLAGVAVVGLMLPVQTWFGKLFGLFRYTYYPKQIPFCLLLSSLPSLSGFWFLILGVSQ